MSPPPAPHHQGGSRPGLLTCSGLSSQPPTHAQAAARDTHTPRLNVYIIIESKAMDRQTSYCAVDNVLVWTSQPHPTVDRRAQKVDLTACVTPSTTAAAVMFLIVTSGCHETASSSPFQTCAVGWAGHGTAHHCCSELHTDHGTHDLAGLRALTPLLRCHTASHTPALLAQSLLCCWKHQVHLLSWDLLLLLLLVALLLLPPMVVHQPSVPN